MDVAKLKKEAAYQAVQNEVRSGMKLGLGTGSTVAHALDALAEALHERGSIRDIVGVPTSEWTTKRATELGIPLTTLDQVDALDVTIDGADEIDPTLNLIKGLGGALLREKMIAQDIEYTNAIENGEMTRYERWVNNRESRQLTLANEALAIDDKKLQMHRKVLDDYQRRQIELLLRLPPPIPPIR